MNTNRSVQLNSRILPSFQEKKVSETSTSISVRAFGIQAAPVADRQTLEKTRLQPMQREAAMEDESQRCSELHD